MTDKPVDRLVTDSDELVHKPAESEDVVHLLHDAADPPPVPPIPDDYSIFLRVGAAQVGGSDPLTFNGDPLTFNSEEMFFTPLTSGGLTFDGETLTFNGEEMFFTPGDGIATPPPESIEGILVRRPRPLHGQLSL